MEANQDPEALTSHEESSQVSVPPQSSTGNLLRDQLLENYNKLTDRPCCNRKCLNTITFEAIYQQVLDLRAQTAAYREAVIMGLLMARRYKINKLLL